VFILSIIDIFFWKNKSELYIWVHKNKLFMRILISWMAVVNDFNNVNEVNDEGLTPEFYRYHYQTKNYDKHILLRTDDMQSIHKANTLTRYLRQEFDFTNIDIRALEINDIININEIKTKVEALLLELKNDDIDIFFQPGTALMQLVWYLLHEALNLNTHLIQAIRKIIAGLFAFYFRP